MTEQPKNIQSPKITQINYLDANALFQANNFSFTRADVCAEFTVPIGVTVKKYTLPPDCFVVEISDESSELRFYGPSKGGGNVETIPRLEESELEWVKKYLERATKFDDNVWYLAEKENYVLQFLFDEKYKKLRIVVINNYSPYSPTDILLGLIQTLFEIAPR